MALRSRSNSNFEFALFGLEGFAGSPITGITSIRFGVFFVAEMMREFALQGAFHNGLGKTLDQALNRLRGSLTGEQFVNQLRIKLCYWFRVGFGFPEKFLSARSFSHLHKIPDTLDRRFSFTVSFSIESLLNLIPCYKKFIKSIDRGE